MSKISKHLIIIILSFALLAAACRPAPKDNAAISEEKLKDEFDAQSAVESNEVINEQLVYADNHITMQAQVNDKVKVLVDAQVILPENDTFPVVRVSPENIPKDKLKTLIEIVSPNNQVYYRDFDGRTSWSKEEIEGMLLYLESTFKDENLNVHMTGDINATMNELKQHYNIALSMDEERLYNTSSIESTYVSAWTSYELKSYLGKDRAADICLYESEDKKMTGLSFSSHNYFEWIKYIEPYSEQEAEGINLSYDECKKIAEDLVKKLDGEDSDLTLYKTEIVYMANSYLDLQKEECEPEYWFEFGKEYDGQLVKRLGAVANSENMDIGNPVKPEVFHVMVGKDGVTDLQWSRYTQIQETINQDASLIDFETILKSFENQIKNQFIWTPSLHNINVDESTSAVVYINDVQLNTMLIENIHNPGHYTTVPVWDFIGYQDFDQEHVSPTGVVFDGRKDIAIITVNAIDGTIIDRNKGY